jgi:hypothetical protein
MGAKSAPCVEQIERTLPGEISAPKLTNVYSPYVILYSRANTRLVFRM